MFILVCSSRTRQITSAIVGLCLVAVTVACGHSDAGMSGGVAAAAGTPDVAGTGGSGPSNGGLAGPRVEWLSAHAGKVQVISVTSGPVHPLVENGRFLEALFRREF